MTQELHCLWAIRANWPVNSHWNFASGQGGRQYYLYRTDYDQVGRLICRLLHDKFGGPACLEPAGAWKAACDKVRAIPGVTMINGHKLEECEKAIPPVDRLF